MLAGSTAGEIRMCCNGAPATGTSRLSAAIRRRCLLPRSGRGHAARVVFFFSSRRWHTSYIGDWSSDVCSSDLVLELPILGTICLQSSSLSVHAAVAALRKRNVNRCTLAMGGTVLLGSAFLLTTAKEWHHLI